MQFRIHNVIHDITGFNNSEFWTLLSIEQCIVTNSEKKVQVSALSEVMHANSTAVSRVLKSLEQKKYVERRTCEKDRRVTYVFITQEGSKAIKQAGEKLDDFFSSVFVNLGDDNLARLTEYMNTLHSMLTKELNERKMKGKEKDE